MNIETAKKITSLMMERNLLSGNIVHINNNNPVKIPESIESKILEIFKQRQIEIDNKIKQIEC